MTEPPTRYRIAIPLAAICLLAILSSRFGGCLIGNERLGFRDVGFFFTPLYGYLAKRESDQALPLHNPLDELGVAIAGETTTALFYPPRRLIFGLIASPETAMGWYVVLHLVLAGVTAAYAARRAGGADWGAALAMIVYPLSGPILFLYCNPPFLVGAAWMPLAIAGGLGLAARPSWRDSLITGTTLAMMTLGGDPQSAVHVILIGFAIALNALCRDLGNGMKTCARLSVALALATLLALPQVIASVSQGLLSVRYGTAARDDTYAFSVAPWHWAEFVLPMASGHLFPTYSRISQLVPGDGRMWVATLYCGLIPLALVARRYRWSGRDRLDGWDTLLPIALLAALGSFGAGYALRMATTTAGSTISDQHVVAAVEPHRSGDKSARIDDRSIPRHGQATAPGDAVGGLYWWLTVLVPGYSGFRYPAKWLSLAALGVAIAAAREFGGWSPGRRAGWVTDLIGWAVVATAIAAAIVIALTRYRLAAAGASMPADPIWGPLDIDRAISDLMLSLACVLAVAVLGTLSLGRDPVASNGPSRHALIAMPLLLCGIDLTIAAWPTVATVDRVQERRASQVLDASATTHPASRISGSGASVRDSLPPRAVRFADRGWPTAFARTPSSGRQRLQDAEMSMRAFGFGRWHLTQGHGVVNPMLSLPGRRMATFWEAANGIARESDGAGQASFWGAILRWLAVDTIRTNAESPPRDVVGSEAKIAWHGEWQRIEPQRDVDVVSMRQRLKEIASGSATAARILVECGLEGFDPIESSAPVPGAESVKVEVLEAARDLWRVRVTSGRPGLVVWKYFQDGNLKGSLIAQGGQLPGVAHPTEVYRCDHLFCGVFVPAGDHLVEVRYEPRWLSPAIFAWGLAWLAVTLGCIGRGCPSLWVATYRSNSANILR